MIRIERYYRYLVTQERLEQIQDELEILRTTGLDDAERSALNRADIGLHVAIGAMRSARTHAQRPCHQGQLDVTHFDSTAREYFSACCQAPMQAHWPCDQKQQCTKCGYCAACETTGSFEAEAMRDLEAERREKRRKP